MIGPTPQRDPSPYGDDLAGQPSQGWFFKWVIGLGLPLLVMGYGVIAMVTRHAVYGGRFPMELHGVNAIAFGVAAISLGVFVHCHYFWGNLYDQHWAAVLGKMVAATGFIGGAGMLIVRIGVYGWG